MEKKNNNNKGLSLVELIVAIAIGSIVMAAVAMLMVHGVQSYKTQSASASIQNEANIALNQLGDNIMEATCLEMSNESAVKTSYIRIKPELYFIYDEGRQTLYQSKKNTTEGASVLCEHVTRFKAELLDTSLVIDENTNNITGISNPLQLKLTIELERMDESREVTRTLGMRNNIKEVDFVIDNSTPSNIINVTVTSIGRYITSDY